MEIKKVAVIGGGTMGNGIAHLFAMNGFPVSLVETGEELAEKALKTIEQNLARMVRKEKIDSDAMDRALGRISTVTDLAEGVGEADLVIEAVPESLELKKKVLSQAGASAPSHAILATNTSSISITKLAAATGRPGQFIGMHFFNPVPIMPLVEIVKGLETNQEVFEAVETAAERAGKTPVAAEDSPGFVSNRVLMPMINEAIFCVHEGVAGPEQVDSIMKLGMNHPMGPLRLADFIGLDVCLDIMEVLYEGFRDPKYRPCPLLVKMVDAGKLGNKTGEGFYRYDG